MSAPDRLVHTYHSDEEIRGFNSTSSAHRALLIAALRVMQDRGAPSGKWNAVQPAPSVVAYCDAVLAPYVAAYRRSQRTWEGLRAFEEEEAWWRQEYAPGMGVDQLKRKLSRGQRAWMAA